MEELKQELLRQVQTAKSIAITTHINPDGDGYCAALALQRILLSLGKNSSIWMDEDNLERYDFLQDEKEAEVRVWHSDVPLPPYDLLFVLDCNSYDRIGQRKALVDNAAKTILLDHHMVEHYPIMADYSLIEPDFVSVGAIIFALLNSEIYAMEPSDRLYVANCLYTTILNDTNNFANANTNAKTFALAANLAALGIKPNKLYKEFFLNHSAAEMRYVGQTLSTLELHCANKILFMHSTLQMSRENDIDPESVMNITRWVQGVKGIDAIVYFREAELGLYKLSLRSVKLDVNRIAARYGGGGHIKASGCTIKGSLAEIKAMLLRDVSEAVLNQ